MLLFLCIYSFDIHAANIQPRPLDQDQNAGSSFIQNTCMDNLCGLLTICLLLCCLTCYRRLKGETFFIRINFILHFASKYGKKCTENKNETKALITAAKKMLLIKKMNKTNKGI